MAKNITMIFTGGHLLNGLHLQWHEVTCDAADTKVSAEQCATRCHKTSSLRCGRDITARQYHFNNLYSFRWLPMLPHSRRSRTNHISLQVIFRERASAAVFCSSPCADSKAVPLAKGASADQAAAEARRSQPTASLVADDMASLASSRRASRAYDMLVRSQMAVKSSAMLLPYRVHRH
jgi:hypothetical protein